MKTHRIIMELLLKREFDGKKIKEFEITLKCRTVTHTGMPHLKSILVDGKVVPEVAHEFINSNTITLVSADGTVAVFDVTDVLSCAFTLA